MGVISYDKYRFKTILDSLTNEKNSLIPEVPIYCSSSLEMMMENINSPCSVISSSFQGTLAGNESHSTIHSTTHNNNMQRTESRFANPSILAGSTSSGTNPDTDNFQRPMEKKPSITMDSRRNLDFEPVDYLMKESSHRSLDIMILESLDSEKELMPMERTFSTMSITFYDVENRPYESDKK